MLDVLFRKSCPFCGSREVRDSRRRTGLDGALAKIFKKNYRCRNCKRRFVSTNTSVLVGTTVLASTLVVSGGFFRGQLTAKPPAEAVAGSNFKLPEGRDRFIAPGQAGAGMQGQAGAASGQVITPASRAPAPAEDPHVQFMRHYSRLSDQAAATDPHDPEKPKALNSIPAAPGGGQKAAQPASPSAAPAPASR